MKKPNNNSRVLLIGILEQFKISSISFFGDVNSIVLLFPNNSQTETLVQPYFFVKYSAISFLVYFDFPS